MDDLKELCNHNSDSSSLFWKKHYIYRKWSQLPYAGTNRIPPAEDPNSGTWPTYFIKHDSNGNFTDLDGNALSFAIRYPDSSIDFDGKQLDIVKETLRNITKHQIQIAQYWGSGPATKQWTPIIDILIDTYGISAPRAARILAATNAAFNDAFVVAWYYKFIFDIARPNQFDQNLETILCTPNHPSYPSGHATIAGCAEVILSYFFESEAKRLKELAEECSISRLYAGVHYPIDNEEGLRLGRNIGKVVVKVLKFQGDGSSSKIDYPISENKEAKLPPPPYKQVISYDFSQKCDSLTDCSAKCCNKTNNSYEDIRV